MSDETAEPEADLFADGSVLALLRDWYHVPVLGALLAFMLWVRTRSFDAFVRDGEVLFSGNDAWYHYREVVYTVENWPQVMPFDPWTYFPQGTAQGQFGTLYDQMVATAAMVVGLGDPSTNTVATTLVVAPAVFGTLVAVPTYLMTKRLDGRLAGVFSVLVLAVFPGTFLTRSLVGSADHNVVEPLFQTTAVLVTMVALAAAARERPVWEQFSDRDFSGLRAPLGWSALAGVALALYMWVWPPGVLLVGILGVFYVVAFTADVLRGTSPEHTAIVATTSMAVTGALMLVPLSTTGFSATNFSLLQPGLAFAIAVGSAVLAWLARLWDRRTYAPHLYPVAVLGLAVAGLAGLALALPSVFGMIRRNLVRFIGFNAGAQQRTILEATPWLSGGDFFPAVFSEYGLALFTALLGGVLLVEEIRRSERLPGDRLLVLVWFAFLLSAAFTQVRFNYYLAVPVAVLNGVFFYRAVTHPWFGELRSVTDANASHVLVAVAIVCLVVTPMAMGVNQTNQNADVRVNSPQYVGANTGPGGYIGWQGTLDWMEDNTPAVGNYGGAGNQGDLDYYGTYADRDDFDYPEGAYGVMSWWDYGHWLTVGAERIPTANPFQQGATEAANYLLSPNASTADDVLAGVSEDDAETQYVAIDHQMASVTSKFGAPVTFEDRYDVSNTDFRKLFYSAADQQYQPQLYVKHQRYYESTMVRLYRYHGSRVEAQPTVIDWAQEAEAGGETVLLGPQGNENLTREFDNMSAAEEFVEEDGTAQIGGFNERPSETVPALEQYRMVKTSEYPGQVQTSLPAYLKLFERVPGATVEGEAPANATVDASVTMDVPSRNDNFTYRQQATADENGEFEMTLPYSTAGYDEWGTDEGYTDVSVRAEGPYTFSAGMGIENGSLVEHAATANVTEGQVVGEDDSPVSVTLEQQNVSAGAAGQRDVPETGAVTGDDGGSDTVDGSGDATLDDYSAPDDGSTPDDTTDPASSHDALVAPDARLAAGE